MPRLADLPTPAPFGPLDSLYGAIRRGFPQVAAARVKPGAAGERLPGEPQEYVTLTYRGRGPKRIIWDDAAELFLWDSGQNRLVGTLDEVERAAERAARTLGVGAGSDRN